MKKFLTAYALTIAICVLVLIVLWVFSVPIVP